MFFLWLCPLLVAGLPTSPIIPPLEHRHIKEDCSSLHQQLDVLKGTLKCRRLPVEGSETLRKLCSSHGMRTIEECLNDNKDSSKASDCLMESLKTPSDADSACFCEALIDFYNGLIRTSQSLGCTNEDQRVGRHGKDLDHNSIYEVIHNYNYNSYYKLCDDKCGDHTDCTGHDAVCNVKYDNCFYCDKTGQDKSGSGQDKCDESGCCEGCNGDCNCESPTPVCDLTDHRCKQCVEDANCQHPAPICHPTDHTCKCLEDGDCHTGEICNNSGLCEDDGKCDVTSECNGYDEVCNDAHDNCFYCGGDVCLPSGCCEGCHSDNNCVHPKPTCGTDHLCGCETHADCNHEEICNPDTSSCEPACVTDADCNAENEGECDVSTSIYTNCYYCDTTPSPSECKPGCKNDYQDTNPVVPYCPAFSPDCDASHKCSAESGSVLLKRIVVTTASCVGCKKNKEGIQLELTGVQDYITCETNKLDHADTTDFSPSPIGTFDTDTDDQVDDGWGGCYKSALKGEVKAAVVTWKGKGTWTVGKICFDWSDSDVNIWVCSAGEGTVGLTQGDSLALGCKESEGIRSCPTT